jgi:hypothetical protein
MHSNLLIACFLTCVSSLSCQLEMHMTLFYFLSAALPIQSLFPFLYFMVSNIALIYLFIYFIL